MTQVPGLPNSMNEGEIGMFADHNSGQSDVAKSWMPTVNAFGSVQTPSASMRAPLSSLGSSNTHADSQIDEPEYLGYVEKDSLILNVGSDDALSYDVFDTCDSLTSNIFEMPLMTTDQAFPADSGQTFGTFDQVSGSAKFHHVIPQGSITQDIDQGILKKRKASVIPELKEAANSIRIFDRPSVLKLLFKYNQDPTVTEMERMAKDTGYSVEYVFKSVLQYRGTATSSLGLHDRTMSIDDSGFASMEQSSINHRS